MKKISLLVLFIITIFIFGCSEIDVVSPTFNALKESVTMTEGDSLDLVEVFGITVTDNVDEFLTINTNIENTSLLDLGIYLVEFTAEDHRGNQAIIQTTLIVENSELGFTLESQMGDSEDSFNIILEPVIVNQRALILYQDLLTPTFSSNWQDSQVHLLIYDTLSASMRTINITEPQYRALPIGIYAEEGGYNLFVNILESVDDSYKVWVYHYDSSLEFLYRSELSAGEAKLSKVVTNSEGDFAIVYETKIEFYNKDEEFLCDVEKDASYLVEDTVAVGNTFIFVGTHENTSSANGFILSHNPSTEAFYLIEDTECNVQNIYYEQVTDANGKLYITAWFEDAESAYSAVIELSYEGEYITEHTYMPTDIFTLFSLFESPIGLGPYVSAFNQDSKNTLYMFGNGLHTENRIDFVLFDSMFPKVFFQIENQYFVLVIDDSLRLHSNDDIAFPKTMSVIKINIK
ncbi:MAG: hypothetical protein AB7U79_00480 [Candidatus Izemoplasmatales bacterium]